MKLFRDKIKARGVRGMVGLQRIFKIMDDDGSKTLSQPEFMKAIKDFRVGISEENVPVLFNCFDANHDGTINYDEFLRGIRGELNDFRQGLVEKAFRKIDKDNSGYLDINDIKDTYNAAKHPDVIQGKKTEEQILMEFLETFEIHHNIKHGNQSDNKVTLDEFMEYYTNVSASIDNDEYFQLMMNNSWNLKGDASTYKKYEKGWANEDASKGFKEAPVPRHKTDPIMRSGQMSGDNPLVHTHQYYKPSGSAARGNVAGKMYSGPPMDKEEEEQKNKQIVQSIREKQPPRNQYQGGFVPGSAGSAKKKESPQSQILVQATQPTPKFQTMLVERFRNKLRERGGRGMIGLRRQFKIMDDNNSGTLDQYEFKKGIKDFQVGIDDKDIDSLFKAFDINGNGDIDFDEFIRVVVGPMNQFRTQIVLKAFDKIDKNGDGVLDKEDIKGRYDASKHPDVKSGKKTEEEVLMEFLETFEMHHNVLHGHKSDGRVDKEEFVEYYTNISANIDNDAYFDLMMQNTWNIEGRNNPDSAPFAGSNRKVTQVSARDMWRLDHHRNLFGTDKKTPFVKSKEGEWSTSNRVGNNDNVYMASSMPSAGSSTFQDPNMYKNQNMTAEQRAKGIHTSDKDMIKMFRDKLASRGARGILGMKRIFKIMDDNNNGTLEIQEFWKAVRDFRIALNQDETRRLFDLFDRNHDGTIDYDELLRQVAGEMNTFRKGLVKRAF